MKKSVTAVVVVCALAFGACSSSDSQESSPADHNEQDIAFAKGMIPHHAQAVEMSNLAETRAANPAVKDLAHHIKDAQQPEIDQMNNWLVGWGEKRVDPLAGEAMDHSDHGAKGHDMAGMLDKSEIDALAAANGVDFDRRFLDGMIKHHEGAVAMAQAEKTNGKSAAAKALAERIIATQQTEIDQMRGLLA